MKGNSGFWLSRSRAIAILIVFIIIVIIVGLMAGLIKSPCPDNPTTTEGPSMSTEEPTTTISPEEEGPWTDPFLPDATIPIHYDMWFYPDFYWDAGTFEGKEDIEINITSKTSHLIVHYKLMNITATTVRRKSDNSELTVIRAFTHEANQYWVTEVDKEMLAGDVVILQLEFTGSLLNGIVGYYKSTYMNALTGLQSWMATTKFQPTDSRKAFPNFDEPKFKTTFTITLKHWSNFTALSNMPEQEVRSYDYWNETTFMKSVPMSSYLVCFIVTDFKYKEDKLADGTPIRVWARPDSIDQVDYALKVGKIMMDYFAKEFDQDFHLPKIDHIAVPDYPSGATEHWGLITYRQARLLFDPTQVTAEDKQAVAAIVGHEVVHNYFGNLVTCRWWDELWLNEGFARFYQYKAIQEAEPTFHMTDAFVVTTQQSIMRADAAATSRPVVLPVTVPDEINQAFDGIVYNKGASVLRMMEDIFGNITFRNAIQRFLQDNKFSTAITPDLWQALQEEVGASMNVTEVMNPWVYQMGLPVVDITVQGSDITATPRRFLINPDDPVAEPPSPYNYKWHLSLSYQTPTLQDRVWLNKTAVSFPDPRNGSEWIKFNKKQGGFYRVNYPVDMWQMLSKLLQDNHEELDPVDRSHLLDDAFNLARATQVSYNVAMDMSKYLKEEMHYFPWRTIGSAFYYIESILYGNQHYDLWRIYIRDLTKNAMDALEVGDRGDHLDKLLRVYIIKMACLQDNPGCVTNITTLFRDWINDPITHAVPANLRPIVYRFGMMKAGTEQDWDIMWTRYENATSGQEALYILRALSQSPQLWLIQKYLGYCLDPTKVRTQDFFTAVRYAASNPGALYYVWTWARANYDFLIARFGTQDRYFGALAPNIASKFKSSFHLEEVQQFYNKYPDAGSGATPRKQSLTTIKENIEWRNRNEEKVVEWLQANVQR